MAEKMYRKGIEIDPRSQRAHINLIVFLSEHGEYFFVFMNRHCFRWIFLIK